MDILPQSVLKKTKTYRTEMVRFLNRLVEIESPSTDPSSQKPLLDELSRALEDISYRARIVSGQECGGYLFARPARPTKNKHWQLLLGHCDTVWPIGTLHDMPARRDGDKIMGPGVLDMKAGLVQIIFALRCLRELHVSCAAAPIVFVNSDEEIGSLESTRWIRRLARRCHRVFVMEPAFGLSGRLKTARKGVGRFTLKIIGKAAHAGINPDDGASAVLELSHQIQRLFALNDPAQGVTVNVGTVDAGLRPNVVAPVATAVVDVRTPTLELACAVEEKIRGLTPVHPEIRIEIVGGFGRIPMEPNSENQKLWLLAKNLGTQIGLDLDQAHVGGASDANTTSQYVATLDGLGAVGEGAHAPHEYAILSQWIERTALLALLIASPI